MTAVLFPLASVPFALLALVMARSRRAKRGRATRARETADCDAVIVQTVRALVDASRHSSVRVLATLDARLRDFEPAMDVFLAFTPLGEELACIYAGGERATHYAAMRLRRDRNDILPARAALAGHQTGGSDGVLIPTDRDALAVPMHDRNELQAVIYVACARGTMRKAEIARTIEHAALPYVLALEREADRVDATYDGLTGMLTPRAFRARLSAEVDRARSNPGSIFTLWFIDTDHFKTVNDTLGHAAGDRVLQAMAELIRAHTVQEVDIVARNGGDEFCALIVGTQKIVALERAQQFCEAVRHADFGIPNGLTTSVGVATYPYDARSASELLEVADAAMYHSKRDGRDRVSFALAGTSFATFR